MGRFFSKPFNQRRIRNAQHALRALAGSALAMALLAGCGPKDPLTPLADEAILQAPTTSQVSFETTNPESIANNLKFVFLVDETGSNSNTVMAPMGLQGSDPTRSDRFDNIDAFVQGLGGPAADYYSLITFTDRVAPADCDATGDNCADQDAASVLVQPLTNNETTFLNSLMTEKADTTDEGGTNYLSPLRKAVTQVSGDIATCMANPGTPASTYVVFIISDGAPNIPGPQVSLGGLNTGCSSVTGVCTTYNDPTGPLATEIKALTGLANTANQACVNSVTLNTGFYYAAGAQDPNAAAVMNQVATWGGGHFIQFLPGTQINLSLFQIPTLQIQIKLSNIFIANLNAVWEGGVLKRDSAANGLSDDFKQAHGANPALRDSDFNGVSDFVEYKLSGQPCGGAQCQTAYAVDYSQKCQTVIDQAASAAAGSMVYKDSSGGEGLNDCEKTLLGLRVDRWDSNANYIPDWFEFVHGMNPVPGSNEADLDPTGDGVTNIQKIAMGFPINMPMSALIGFTPNQYTLTDVGPDGTRESYSLDITHVPLVSGQNRIRVYVLENSIGVRDLRFMRMAEKTITLGDTPEFVESDFGTPLEFQCSSDPTNANYCY